MDGWIPEELLDLDDSDGWKTVELDAVKSIRGLSSSVFVTYTGSHMRSSLRTPKCPGDPDASVFLSSTGSQMKRPKCFHKIPPGG